METVGTPTLLFRFPNKDRFHLTSREQDSRESRLFEEQFPTEGEEVPAP